MYVEAILLSFSLGDPSQRKLHAQNTRRNGTVARIIYKFIEGRYQGHGMVEGGQVSRLRPAPQSRGFKR